jgi:thioredoxin 2
MSDSVHVVCPGCGAVNRVPQDRLGEGAKCGKCHAPLFSGVPLALDEQGFTHQVARSDLPLMVDFWAPWCGPCRMMAPAFEEAARMLEPQVRLVKVNTEEAQGLAGRLGIRSIPTLALFRGGKEVARTSGAMDAGRLVAWARQYL